MILDTHVFVDLIMDHDNGMLYYVKHFPQKGLGKRKLRIRKMSLPDQRIWEYQVDYEYVCLCSLNGIGIGVKMSFECKYKGRLLMIPLVSNLWRSVQH